MEESASGRKGQVESKEGADKSNVVSKVGRDANVTHTRTFATIAQEKQDHAHSFTMHASDIKVKLFDFSSIENKLVKSAKGESQLFYLRLLCLHLHPLTPSRSRC